MKFRKKAIAVRPYGTNIRQLVFEALESACVDVVAPLELLEGTNDEMVNRLRPLRADVLLVPFHVVRTGKDGRTNGLELLEILRQEIPWAKNTVAIMPVSVFAKAAFEGAFRKLPLANVFPLYEDELASPGLPERLEQFCMGVLRHEHAVR